MTEEDVLVLELITKVFDAKLRGELIRRASDTDYEGLVKIAKTWHTANIIQAVLLVSEIDPDHENWHTPENYDEIDVGNDVDINKDWKRREIEYGSKLSNGGNNEESNVNLRQELYRKSSDEIHRGSVTIAETWPDIEITQAGLALDEVEKAARRSAPLHTQRKRR